MYKTLGSAARTAKKWNAKAGKTEYSACHIDDYRRNVVHMVTRVNYMTGKEYQEASNTPGHCSPSSEAYWSN